MASLAIGLMGLTTLISGALPISGFWIFVVCCFFLGASGTFMNAPVMAYVQESIAPEMMGKVFSLLDDCHDSCYADRSACCRSGC